MVSCQQVQFPSREVATLSDQFCMSAGAKPEASMPCTTDVTCNKPVKLNSDDSHYVQLQYQKMLRLVAGGKAVLIPRTSLRVRCPVQKFSPRSDITWEKEGEPIAKQGRVRVNKRGVLIVMNTRQSDEGIYTCHADDVSTTMTLEFHSEDVALDKYIKRGQIGARNSAFLNMFRQHTERHSNRNEQHTEPYIRKHFASEQLPYSFVASAWGACSLSCGGAGLQERQVTCELNFEQYYLVVSDDYCYEKGLDRPLSREDCGFEQCPQWEVGQYQPVRAPVDRPIPQHCIALYMYKYLYMYVYMDQTLNV